MSYTTTLSPTHEKRLLLTLAGIQFTHILDFMIIMPLAPMLMRAFNLTTGQFGLLVSAYTFTAAVIPFPDRNAHNFFTYRSP